MSEKNEPVNAQAHLKVALISFGFWLFLIYVIFENIRELGGLSGLIGVMEDGDYSDLLLLALSIFLLARAFHSTVMYFRHKDDNSDMRAG